LLSPVRLAQAFGFPVLVAIILFGAAGRVDLPLYWMYIAMIAALSLGGVFLIDEDLARERIRPGGQPLGLRVRLAFLLYIAHWVIAGLDRGRFHWSDTVPLTLQLAGIVIFAAGSLLGLWAMHVNPFFSSVVRIQRERGHRPVTSGPYRWVRHPGYAGAIPAVVASGMALCSWGATALGALGVPFLVWRTIAEDRVLRAQLPGYEAYAQSVRWRLLPGLW
jgi:protein-S-isoprenylcysteine O-methyltransferase Ste14